MEFLHSTEQGNGYISVRYAKHDLLIPDRFVVQ